MSSSNMNFHKIVLLIMTILTMAVIGCDTGGLFDPRDTVQVPEELTGEDSIAYIENAVMQSPISVEDLLNLAEVHTIDEWIDGWLEAYEYMDADEKIFYFGEERAEGPTLTHRDSCAMRLANRFMRMHHLVDLNGDAMDKLQWVVAVNTIIDTFCAEVPEVKRDSAIDEVLRLFNKFMPLTQSDMNLESYVASSIDYYRTLDAYRKWLDDVPNNIMSLAKEEYQAWHDLNEARFSLWRDVYFTPTWYTMKPMEIEEYYQHLSENRRAELNIDREIILGNKPYQQKGKTVTKKQWEDWIKERSLPEDYEYFSNMESYISCMPSDSTIAACTTRIRETFSRWLVARQALAAALPKEQSRSYDNHTADMHCRIIGTLPDLIPFSSSNGNEKDY